MHGWPHGLRHAWSRGREGTACMMGPPGWCIQECWPLDRRTARCPSPSAPPARARDKTEHARVEHHRVPGGPPLQPPLQSSTRSTRCMPLTDRSTLSSASFCRAPRSGKASPAFRCTASVLAFLAACGLPSTSSALLFAAAFRLGAIVLQMERYRGQQEVGATWHPHTDNQLCKQKLQAVS